jgi:hypothetical protein
LNGIDDIETWMLGGHIGPNFKSTVRQDIDSALYGLAEFFPEFLTMHPRYAIRSMITAWENWITEKHSGDISEYVESEFILLGQKVRIKVDLSSIWDVGDYRSSDAQKMLDIFEQRLAELIENDDQNDIQEMLSELITRNYFAGPWRRLLVLGARYPESFGIIIRELGWSSSILICVDTYDIAGEFIKKIYPLLDVKDRENIEVAIFEIPKIMSESGQYKNEPKLFNDHRNTLLGCLSEDHLVLDVSRSTLSALKHAGGPPKNKIRKGPKAEFRALTSRERLELMSQSTRHGDNSDIPESLLALLSPVESFYNRNLNQKASQEDLDQIWPEIKRLNIMLEKDSPDTQNTKFQEVGRIILSNAAELILISAEGPIGEKERFAKKVLLSEQAKDCNAARGLMAFVAYSGKAEQQLIERILMLSKSNDKNARYTVAKNLYVLAKHDQELVWNVAEEIARQEQEVIVLIGLIEEPLWALTRINIDRAFPLLAHVFNFIGRGAKTNEALEFCLELFVDNYLRFDHPESYKILSDLIDNALEREDAANLIIFILGKILEQIWKVQYPGDLNAKTKALSMLLNLVNVLIPHCIDIKTKLISTTQPGLLDEDISRFNSCAKLVDDVAHRLYFASGASKEKQAKESLSFDQNKLMTILNDVEPIIAAITPVGHAQIAYHLIELLDYLSSADPEKVFGLVAEIIHKSVEGGYQHESMALDQVVKFVEHYLSEYRDVLYETTKSRQQLTSILDIFVESGWPEAARLVYRLDEIFR